MIAPGTTATGHERSSGIAGSSSDLLLKAAVPFQYPRK